MEEWSLWLRSIEDEKLVAKAKRMDLSLDDIPVPAASRPDETPGHWCEPDDVLYYDVLHWETRRALQKAIRERALPYREFWLKIVTAIVTAIVPLFGVILGYVLGHGKH